MANQRVEEATSCQHSNNPHLAGEAAIDTLRNDYLLDLIESRPVLEELYKYDETKAKKPRAPRKKKTDAGAE